MRRVPWHACSRVFGMRKLSTTALVPGGGWGPMHPLVKNSCISAVFAILGDSLMQRVEGKTLETWDWSRLARFVAFRAVFHTPVYTVWIAKLEKLPFHGYKAIGAKVLADSIIFTTAFQVTTFTYMAVAEGKSVTQGLERAATVMTTSVPASWCL